jgi:hypothetical protein
MTTPRRPGDAFHALMRRLDEHAESGAPLDQAAMAELGRAIGGASERGQTSIFDLLMGAADPEEEPELPDWLMAEGLAALDAAIAESPLAPLPSVGILLDDFVLEPGLLAAAAEMSAAAPPPISDARPSLMEATPQDRIPPGRGAREKPAGARSGGGRRRSRRPGRSRAPNDDQGGAQRK